MTTTEIPVLLEIDAEGVAESLRAATEKLDGAGGEVVLDFASVRRIGPGALKALEALANDADKKTVKLVLRRVNVTVYKVLKLARLTRRLSFVP